MLAQFSTDRTIKLSDGLLAPGPQMLLLVIDKAYGLAERPAGSALVAHMSLVLSGSGSVGATSVSTSGNSLLLLPQESWLQHRIEDMLRHLGTESDEQAKLLCQSFLHGKLACIYEQAGALAKHLSQRPVMGG